MSSSIIIRRSPVVIVKNLVMMQLGAIIIYALAAVLADYGAFYKSLSLSQVISYELAKFLIISLLELALTCLIFFRWFAETYTISANQVIYEQGWPGGRRQNYELIRPLSVTTHGSLIARLFRYGTVRVSLKNKPLLLTLRDVSHPHHYANLIREGKLERRLAGQLTSKADIKTLLVKAEDEHFERKSSLRWDYRLGRVNGELERTIMKTIAAFLNTEGGELLIGVDDQGQVLGLEPDCQTMHRPDLDGFENYFTLIFRKFLGADLRPLVHCDFPEMNSQKICHISVESSPKPVFLKDGNQEEFFVRTGNTTTPLKLSEATAYIQRRWSNI